MTMTVADLIRVLEDYDPDAEVRLAQQPSWPFEYSVAEVAEAELECSIDRDMGIRFCTVHDLAVPDADEWTCDEGKEPPVVYIAEGTQLGYLPGDARDALGW